MNIDDMTIKQAKELVAMFGAEPGHTSPHIGRKCIIRTYASGVHFGELVSQNGREVELKNARRLWRWFAVGGISLSEVAKFGIDPSKSKICTTLDVIALLDGLETIPCTDEAIKTIIDAETYTP